jgi:hypothetical protein
VASLGSIWAVDQNSVTHYGLEPLNRTSIPGALPGKFATPVWPVFHKPSLLSVDEILASTLQLLLVLDLLALGVPISNCHVLNIVHKSIGLLNTREWLYMEYAEYVEFNLYCMGQMRFVMGTCIQEIRSV